MRKIEKTNELIDAIISILIEESIEDLPNICLRYGLDIGDTLEASKNKNIYIKKRLESKNQLFLLDLARRLLDDYYLKADFLKNVLYKVTYNGLYTISELTRKNIMDTLYSKGNIEGKLELTDFLNRIWNLEQMSSTDHRFNNALGDIWQHMINNSDWDEVFLYEDYLKLLTSSDQIFISFLETVVHPIVRNQSEIDEYIKFLDSHLIKDGYHFISSDTISGYTIYKIKKVVDGVKGAAKNLIFAALGKKPDIVISDSINNDIKIINDESNCLVYDRPITDKCLLWLDLVKWWSNKNNYVEINKCIERELYLRLLNSLDSQPEKIFLKSYFALFKNKIKENLPALIPQVYLHYDPYTQKQRFDTKILPRQRMDFLLLFSNHIRVVIEIDGKQHYSNGDTSSPRLYAEMVRADRALKLQGYEVYRFGGFEFINEETSIKLIKDFFEELFKKHEIEY